VEQTPYSHSQWQPTPPIFTADRVLGIIGIVLFSCCAMFGVFGAVGQALGATGGQEMPPELQPEAWETALSLAVNIGMLVGSIGLAMGRRWGMLLLLVMGTISILYVIYSFVQFPQKADALAQSLQQQAKSEEERQGIEMGLRMGRYFILVYAAPILLYVLYSILRLSGNLGPRPV